MFFGVEVRIADKSFTLWVTLLWGGGGVILEDKVCMARSCWEYRPVNLNCKSVQDCLWFLKISLPGVSSAWDTHLPECLWHSPLHGTWPLQMQLGLTPNNAVLQNTSSKFPYCAGPTQVSDGDSWSRQPLVTVAGTMLTGADNSTWLALEEECTVRRMIFIVFQWFLIPWRQFLLSG